MHLTPNLSPNKRHQLLVEYFEAIHSQGSSAEDLLPELETTCYNELIETLSNSIERCKQNPHILPNVTLLESNKFQPTVFEKDGKCHIKIPKGVLYALDDAFLRLNSCPNFIGSEMLTGKLLEHKELRSILTEQLGYSVPKIRYLNYDQEINSFLLDQKNTSEHHPYPQIGSNYEYQGPFLDPFVSGYYSFIPYCQDRHKLSQFMLEIALVCIIHHEKTHFNRGHLDYLKTNLSFHSVDETQTTLEINDQDIFKALEWDADNGATNAVFKIFDESFIECLPPFAHSAPNEWLTRVLFTTIGVVQLILQNSRVHYGTNEDHPKPKTRLASAFFKQIYEAGGNEDTIERLKKCFYTSLRDISYASDIISEDGPITGFDADGKYIKSSKVKLDFVEDIDELKKLLSLLNFITYEDVPADMKFTDCEISTNSKACHYYGLIDKEWFSEMDHLGKIFHDILPKLKIPDSPKL